VEDLAATVLRDPVKVVIGTVNAGATTIDQKLVFVGRYEAITLQVVVITLLACRCQLLPYLTGTGMRVVLPTNPLYHLTSDVFLHKT
jgi:hypothetical protein